MEQLIEKNNHTFVQVIEIYKSNLFSKIFINPSNILLNANIGLEVNYPSNYSPSDTNPILCYCYLLTEFTFPFFKKYKKEVLYDYFKKQVKIRDINYYLKSDNGKIRDLDEDSLISIIRNDSNNFRALLVLADGVGGNNAGEIASKITCTEIAKRCSSLLYEDNDDQKIILKINDGIKYAHNMIIERTKYDSKTRGMASTVEVIFYCKNNLYISHIGDSRVYKINNDGIFRLTRDHSSVQEYMDKYNVSEEEARLYAPNAEITQALGYESKVSMINPYYTVSSLYKQDTLLVCCDGLTDLVSEDEIHKIVTGIKDLKKASEKLIEKANLNGGTDNISLILMKDDSSPNISKDEKTKIMKEDSSPNISKDEKTKIMKEDSSPNISKDEKTKIMKEDSSPNISKD